MSKKEVEIVEDDLGAMLGFGSRKPVALTKTAYVFISDEGGVGKSTAAIAFTMFLRKLSKKSGKKVDAWQCDPDHMKLFYGFGKRDEQGDLLPYSEQTPDYCGVLDIREEGARFIDSLASDAEHKIYDMPAASEDELPKIFQSAKAFIKAFVDTGHKIVFVVPFVTPKDSLDAVAKLDNLFSSVVPEAVIEYALVVNASMIKDKEGVKRSLGGNDIKRIASKNKVYIGNIDVQFVNGFQKVIDFTEHGVQKTWLEKFYCADGKNELGVFHHSNMDEFLNQYYALVRDVTGGKF
ncbi:hypothetical protein KTD15_06385 [Burkholderia multivorans]|uniref:hypothetical protein n=1 Tax=Burkholderia multivorans TaxID=87883 RepID=UPI001C23757A|nr:hypothetical protein [Burkholderia multivorans]MBU9118422.1 hypothetical protein [Burkholderia multivorans]